MPLTKKGQHILSAMQSQYGKDKGKSIFYASKNAGRISGVEKGFSTHLYPTARQVRVPRQVRTSLHGAAAGLPGMV